MTHVLRRGIQASRWKGHVSLLRGNDQNILIFQTGLNEIYGVSHLHLLFLKYLLNRRKGAIKNK